MLEYKKGWYSICLCKKLDLDIIEKEEIPEAIADESIKYFFLKSFENDTIERYQIIKKSWVIIESFISTEGLIKKKIPILKRFTLDYYFKNDVVIFHTGFVKIENIIKYLVNSTQTQIFFIKNSSLFTFLKKLNELKVDYKLIEGMLINYELEGGTMANIHFKRITQKDKSMIFNQRNIYLSWIKISVIGKENSFELTLYSNGTFYQNKNDPLIFKLLHLYLSIKN